MESLNEENWVEQAQGQGGMFHVYAKDRLSNANTNTNMNELIFMEDVDEVDKNDTLSSFVKEKSQQLSRKQHSKNRNNNNHRYDYDKNTIEEMENELF